MPRFFTGDISGDSLYITGENGRHIVKSLRMRAGEALTICDGMGTDAQCIIENIDEAGAYVKVLSRAKSSAEAGVQISLYQCLPKSDKMDMIIQKVTELGCVKIYPVNSRNCVVTVKGKEDKKCERWQKIALEAAKQSGRGVVPIVGNVLNFSEAVKTAPGTKIMFYEGGGQGIKEILSDKPREISIFVGPEGGFDPTEVQLAKENDVKIATLGPRILRTETAPIAGLTIIMYETGNME